MSQLDRDVARSRLGPLGALGLGVSATELSGGQYLLGFAGELAALAGGAAAVAALGSRPALGALGRRPGWWRRLARGFGLAPVAAAGALLSAAFLASLVGYADRLALRALSVLGAALQAGGGGAIALRVLRGRERVPR